MLTFLLFHCPSVGQIYNDKRSDQNDESISKTTHQFNCQQWHQRSTQEQKDGNQQPEPLDVDLFAFFLTRHVISSNQVITFSWQDEASQPHHQHHHTNNEPVHTLYKFQEWANIRNMGLFPSVNPLKNSKGKQIRANLSDSAMLHLEKTPSGRV